MFEVLVFFMLCYNHSIVLASTEHPPHYTLTNTYTGICDNTDKALELMINDVSEKVQLFDGQSI